MSGGVPGEEPRFRTAEVARMLGLSCRSVRSYARMQLVHPQRDAARGYLFSFGDLVVLRSARELSRSHLSPGAIGRSLRMLSGALPPRLPPNGLRIGIVGDTVVVRAGDEPWQAAGGQLLLDLSVRPAQRGLAFVANLRQPRAGGDEVGDEVVDEGGDEEGDDGGDAAGEHFRAGYATEAIDPATALRHYSRALRADPRHAGAAANLGRLLQQLGKLSEALEVYESFLANGDDALVRFNAGVALEDLGRWDEALRSYRQALALDPSLDDAHFNAGLLSEFLKDEVGAIRHLSAYRRGSSGA